MKCKVCGKEFELKNDNRYVVLKNKGNMIMHDYHKYEAFDCPFCGCQNIVNKRFDEYHKQENNEEGENEE